MIDITTLKDYLKATHSVQERLINDKSELSICLPIYFKDDEDVCLYYLSAYKSGEDIIICDGGVCAQILCKKNSATAEATLKKIIANFEGALLNGSEVEYKIKSTQNAKICIGNIYQIITLCLYN